MLLNMIEVFEILHNVGPEKECVLDKISARMLKDGAKILTEPILQIVNMSLDSKFPLGCKTATVSQYAERENCRPALPFPLISRVIKRVGNKHIIKYFSKY